MADNYLEKKFDEFYKTQSIKGIGDGVNVDISVEASNYSYEELKEWWTNED